MSIASRWKGKGRARALEARDEGPGGTEGIVLPLDQVGSGVYDVAYTLPMKFGDNGQQFSLQVDTGSSDLWVASTSCSTSSCSQTNGRQYNPSGATETGVNFSIQYLEGMAAGPIVWDRVSVGGYTIENQALSAVNNVQNEPLAPNFSGILGLALPLNSVIATSIPPVTNNDPDGAAWASNLFSITPTSLAPASRFLSLALARPGSDRVPSVLGIGRHPAALVPDPSLVEYGSLVSERTGIFFWKVSVRAITIYVNGEAKPVNVGRSNTGSVFPSAVIDSGVPLILTTSTIANAIYGAIGINPASDGNYYVPCTTPLNMTITIDNRPELPLHPLDLTAEPPQDNVAQFCVGLIQVADAALTADTSVGDMILGVPFMRNVYTVMAYTTPTKDGTFTPLNSVNQTDLRLSTITPRLGLMSLTDPQRALQEFNTVRVLNQPIPPTNGTATSNNGDSNTINVGGRKLSVGIVVLIGLLSFFAFCCMLFAIWWFLVRRRLQKSERDATEGDFGIDKKTAYMLTRRGSGQLNVGPSEDELRRRRYQTYLRKERILSGSTVDSDRTQVEDSPAKFDNVEEFGLRKERSRGVDEDEVWDPRTPLVGNDETSFAASQKKGAGPEVPLTSDQDRHSPPLSNNIYFSHNRQESDPVPFPAPHRHLASVDMPLLGAPPMMGEIDEGYDTNNVPRSHHHSEPSQDDFSEFGFVSGATMAGVGTASRTSKIGLDQSFQDSVFNRDSLMSMSSGGTVVNVGIGQSVDSGNSSFSPTARNARSPLGFDVDAILEGPTPPPPSPPPADSS